MNENETIIRVQTEIPLDTSGSARRIKRRRGIPLQLQYLQAVRARVQLDASGSSALKVVGAGQGGEGRLDPPRRFDDVTVVLLMSESEYAAMRACADRFGLRRKQYCRHAIVTHIAAAAGERRKAPVDDAHDGYSWVSLALGSEGGGP